MAKRIFGRDGLLAKTLPKYTERPQQEELAKLINTGIKRNRTIVAEAPTGVGKSISGLVPIAHRLTQDLDDDGERERTFVICTATIALQEQYIRKELPLLRELGYDFEFGLMKGMRNYICPFKFAGVRSERKNAGTEMVSKWFNKTETGDLSELTPSELLQLASIDIRANYEECLRNKCPYYDYCPYYNMRNAVRLKDIIVVNYHYFLSHMRLVMANNSFILLPRVSNLLCDEAHVIKEYARDFFGYTISSRSLKPLVSYLGKNYPDTAQHLIKSANAFFNMLNSYLGGVQMRLAYDLDPTYYGRCYGALLQDAEQAKALIQTEISNFMRAIAKESTAKPLLYARRISSQIGNITSMLGFLEEYLVDKEKARRSGQTIWVERDKRNEVTLAMKPLYIDQIFSSMLPKLCSQATYMSATLDEKSFVKDVGIKDYVFREIGQVFDYSKQAALYIPSLGEPNSTAFHDAVGLLLVDICKMLGGNILALFTSFNALNIAAKTIENLPEQILKYPLLVQDNVKSNAYLASEMAKGNRVLLGTRSFFQGVDFPGSCVKVVLLNQLPFKHHSDPVTQALQYFKMRDWFQTEQLPHTKILLKQAFGRLIRRETDTGMVIVCDDRLLTAHYGKQLLNALPTGLPVITDWEPFVEKLKELCE